MEKDILSFAVEKTHELIGAPTCSSETKAAAEAWLNAVGTEQEAEETKKYIDELEADIMPIANIAVHAKEIKAAGAKFCDCPACAAVEAILEKKEDILK